MMFRNPRLPWSQLLQAKAGVMGSIADSADPAAGLDDELAVDGSIYYLDDAGGGGGSQFQAYAGRDGVVGSFRDGRIQGGETATRLQIAGRIWPFWREGFYRGDEFVPVGRYEGSDYEVYLGAGREAAQDLFVEMGPFYKRYSFERSDATDPTYTVPEDFAAYGARVFLEHNTVQLDRRTRMPREGFILTALFEREWNDSNGEFGSAAYQSSLASAYWRGRARMEWYLPEGAESAWEIFAAAGYTDETDRIANYEAQRPQGNLWVDGQLRYRLPIGTSFTISPWFQGQYVKILDESGQSTDEKFFYGFGLEAWMHLSQTVSMNAWYSWLNNESRPSVSVTEDIHGECMFYAGAVVRFGGAAR